MTGKVYAKPNFAAIEPNGIVDITSLRAGVYFLKIKVNDQGFVQSFVIP